ncbi:MAG: Rieske 2Fe-2S domain-containing protein [Acidiferrobacterales bacterium]|nr:Rieske 2Fe-2S domain-containing protein [Acidiferrobacterales bacterium]
MTNKVQQTRWSRKAFDGYSIRNQLDPDPEFLHVGPSTPCGEYLRRFWHPVAMSSQLNNATPVAIRILDEDLVIFRDLSGQVGLLHRHCAHRRASLEFGRIEQRGIRCCYHGWHFDVDGTILDTPGEPEDSKIRYEICQGAYPTREYQGLIFAYMGPPDEMTEFPFMDSMAIPDHDLVPYSIHSPNNWLQETENAIDPFHSVFLHGRISGPQFPGLEHFTELPVVVYRARPEGILYAHARRTGDLVRLRFHDYLLPNLAQNGGMFQVMDKPKIFGRTSLTKWVVPLDDTNSRKFGWRHFNDKDEVLRQGSRENVGWETVDFYGQTGHRSYDERQGNPGDWDAWTSQGPMNVHKREYLGSTDKGVAMLRARLRKDIRAVADGKSVNRITGTRQTPFRTYGGDTVLSLPQFENDSKYIEDVMNRVMDVYEQSEKCSSAERIDYIKHEIALRYPEAV